MSDIKRYIDDATKNILEDRAATKTLLLNLMKYMQKGDELHREYGHVAAKYLETLQRSNEQLVKLATLVQKREGNSNSISNKEKEELFDLINSDHEG